ncbi:MAG: CHAT domain-containing protein [Okeania sp. SIO3B3]|nr:CHAT domain-containing protein [Okeania sp. SIO3B3]
MSKFVNYTLTIRNDGTIVPHIDGIEYEPKQFNSEQLKHIETHLDLLGSNKLDSQKMFTYFGNYLFSALLQPVVGHFEVAYKKIDPNQTNILRIRIVFEGVGGPTQLTSQIINLPWEFLYYAGDNNTFLGTHPRVALSYGYQTWLNNPIDGYAVREPRLRVLFVHCHPSALDEVGFTRLVEKTLTELNLNNTVEVNQLNNPKLYRLFKEISDKPPDVLHFLGHGKPGQLALGDLKDGETYWLTDKSLSDLQQGRGVKLVVLQACEGASPSEELAFTGTAAELVKNHIPAVIAFRYPISQSLAWNFVRTLYHELAAGKPVDVSVQAGRRELAMREEQSHASRNFGAPVLWMRLRDGLLFAPSMEAADETKPSSSENAEIETSEDQDVEEVKVIDETNQFLIDLSNLENLLKSKEWLKANQETTNLILEDLGYQKRGWLEEKDVQNIKCELLRNIDQLWMDNSDGKFGFSAQKEMWEYVKKKYSYLTEELKEIFGVNVGWYHEEGNRWLKRPQTNQRPELELIKAVNNKTKGCLPTLPSRSSADSISNEITANLIPYLVKKL